MDATKGFKGIISHFQNDADSLPGIKQQDSHVCPLNIKLDAAACWLSLVLAWQNTQKNTILLYFSANTGDSEVLLETDCSNSLTGTFSPAVYFCHCVYPQLLDGLDVLQKNNLTSLKQEFIAHSVVGTFTNLTAQDFSRWGTKCSDGGSTHLCLSVTLWASPKTNKHGFVIFKG